MPGDRKYNVDRELWKIMNATDDALEFLWDIRLALELGEDLQTIISFIKQPFDSLETLGKH